MYYIYIMTIRKSNSRYTPEANIKVEVITGWELYDKISDEEIIAAVKKSKHAAFAAERGVVVIMGGGSSVRRSISANCFK